MTIRAIAAVLAVATVLAACGGGGGGSGSGLNRTPDAAPASASALRVSARSDATGLASSVRTSFGSVVAATNRSVSGIDSSFRSGRAQVTVSRGSAPAVTLDTANSFDDIGTGASIVGLPGRSGRTRYVFGRTTTSATLGLVAVDWANSDPNDYLAGGYWLHVDAAGLGGSPATLEAGAFVAGPELNLASPPTMPVSGSATYRGTAAGMYAAEYGSEFGAARGSTELGEFFGVATLTADFSAGTIEGCVGCAGNTRYVGVNFDPAGRSQTFDTAHGRYQVRLGRVPFDRGRGTFQGSNVRITSGTVSVVSSSGVWAGQFSNRMSAGEPRLVAGTFAAHGSTSGGSRAALIGAFGSGKQ